MRKISYVIIGLLAIIAVLGIISAFKDSSKIPSPVPTPIPTPTPTVIEEPKNITVTEPLLNAVVTSPITLKGTARVFENVLNYRLKDTQGKILAEGHMTAAAADVGQFGPYEVKIDFKTPSTDYGVLEVFSLSAKDGSEINQSLVYLKFSQ